MGNYYRRLLFMSRGNACLAQTFKGSLCKNVEKSSEEGRIAEESRRRWLLLCGDPGDMMVPQLGYYLCKRVHGGIKWGVKRKIKESKISPIFGQSSSKHSDMMK